MEVRRYVEILFAYRWLLIIVPVVAAAIAFAATYASSPKFVATATVQLIPEDAEARTLTLRGSGGGSAAGFRDPADILAQGVIENLASRDVSVLIAHELALPPGQQQAPQGLDALKSRVRNLASDVSAWLRYGYVAAGPQDDAALPGSVSANLIRGTYHMKLSATAADPQLAADLANAAVPALSKRAIGVAADASSERRRHMEAELNAAQARVGEARGAVQSYIAEHAALPGSESLRVALAAAEQSRTNLERDQLALAEASRRLAEIRDQLSRTSPESVTRSTTVAQNPTTSSVARGLTQNPLYTTLQERVTAHEELIAAIEARRAQSERQIQAQNELSLVEARGRLAVVDEQLAQTPAELVTVQTTETNTSQGRTMTRTVGPNSTHLALQQRVLDLRQEIAGLQARQQAAQGEERAQTELAIIDAQRRLTEAQQQMTGSSPETVLTETIADPGATSGTVRSTSSNPLYGALQGRRTSLQEEIRGLESRRAAAEGQLRATNELALDEARERLARARAQLAETPAELVTFQATEASSAPGSTTSQTAAPNAAYQALQDRANGLEQDLVGLEERVGREEPQYQARNQELFTLLAHDAQLAGLNQVLTQATDTHNRRATELSNVRFEDSRPATQLRVVDRATAPIYPTSPIKVLWALVAAITGLALVVVFAFVRSSADISVRSPAVLEDALDLQLLAVVPTVRNGHSNGNGHTRVGLAARRDS